jgi:hypothetical protein
MDVQEDEDHVTFSTGRFTVHIYIEGGEITAESVVCKAVRIWVLGSVYLIESMHSK